MRPLHAKFRGRAGVVLLACLVVALLALAPGLAGARPSDSSAATAVVTAVRAAGPAVGVTIRCDAPSGVCRGALTFTSRVKRRSVTVAVADYAVPSGSSATTEAGLDHAGSALLAAHYTLAATLKVTGAARATQAVTFRYAVLKASISAHWAISGDATVPEALVLHAVPAGAAVEVLCSSRRCPFREAAFGTSETAPTTIGVGARLDRAHLPPGSRITVQISRTDAVGEDAVFTMRARRQPSFTRRCLVPGGQGPTDCVR